MLAVASNESKLLAWKDFHETFFNRVIVDFVIRMSVHSAYQKLNLSKENSL